VDEASSLLGAVNKKLEKNDGFSIFGDFVVNKVRDLNSSRLHAITQHNIHTVLLEAEMELHNIPTHNEHTQLPLHFDSKPTSISYTVASTPTPQSSSSSVSDFQIIPTNPTSTKIS
jgi:hypothetical protein